MAELNDAPMDEAGHDAALGVAARHALHDEELVAAYAGGNLEAGPDADRAQSFVDRCVACRDLHRDIAAIGVTLRAAGTAADVGSRLAAPRDFRLTAEQAAALRPGAWLRPAAAGVARVGLRDRLAGALRSFGTPLGASLATLGVVGLLVGSLGSGAMGSLQPVAGSGGPGPTSGTGIDLTGPDGPKESRLASAVEPAATNYREIDSQAEPIIGTTAGSPPPGVWILGGSAVLVALGLVLIVLGARARTRREPRTG